MLGCSRAEADRKPFIASMGIYVFKRSTLLNHLGAETEHMDFGGDVIPSIKDEGARAASFSARPDCHLM